MMPLFARMSMAVAGARDRAHLRIVGSTWRAVVARASCPWERAKPHGRDAHATCANVNWKSTSGGGSACHRNLRFRFRSVSTADSSDDPSAAPPQPKVGARSCRALQRDAARLRPYGIHRRRSIGEPCKKRRVLGDSRYPAIHALAASWPPRIDLRFLCYLL
jgi:hypothetical protein